DAADMEIEALRQRIAELEREQEQLRPVGVMSEKAFHRLENSECRFIALWPRPGIFLPRKRPEDGVIVYARTAAAAGIKMEAE
ncbi:ead/Ea22-like family protein, partial [Klebsiella pneumoniae]